MIAILDARPGMAGPLREVVAGLARQVRREPGCLTFTARDLRLAARVRRQQAAGEQTPDGCRAGLLEQARPPR
jgi:hypothetical protein